MKLKDCTKEELLFVVEQMKLSCFSSGELYLSTALCEVDRKRREKRLVEADKQADYSDRKRREYCDLLVPYEGKKIQDIPTHVLEQARTALAEAQKADRKWAKLMGLERRLK